MHSKCKLNIITEYLSIDFQGFVKHFCHIQDIAFEFALTAQSHHLFPFREDLLSSTFYHQSILIYLFKTFLNMHPIAKQASSCLDRLERTQSIRYPCGAHCIVEISKRKFINCKNCCLRSMEVEAQRLAAGVQLEILTRMREEESNLMNFFYIFKNIFPIYFVIQLSSSCSNLDMRHISP